MTGTFFKPAVAALAALGAAVFAAAPAAAQDYPSQPIVINVGFSPGGSSDISARTFARFLEQHLPGDASVVVENRPGGDGANMYRYVAGSKPDGYTLGLIITPTAVSKLHEGRDLQYDMNSFDYVGMLMSDYTVLPVANDSQFKTLADMVEFGKEKAGQLTIGVTGFSGPYIAQRELFKKAGVEVTWVPYNGGGELSAALLGGHVHGSAVNLPSAVSYKDTQRPLVVFAPKRLEDLSDVPTVVESGYDVVGEVNRGIVAPANLPKAVSDVLVKAVADAATDPAYIAELKKVNVVPDYRGPAEYRKLVENAYETYGEIWKTDPWLKN